MIRFTCKCGRSLKAPDTLAGKESRCPACGLGVVVPRLLLTSIGAQDDSTEYALSETATEWAPSVLQVVAPVRRTVFKRHRFEAWCDPLLGVKFVFRLSGILAVLTAIGAALYPSVINGGISWVNGLSLSVVWGAAMGLLIGYGCNFLDSVLANAVGGGADGDIHVPDFDPSPAMTSFVRWALGFVSGPAILIYFAFQYWIHCGDMTFIDSVILMELTVPALSYWMIGLLVLTRQPERLMASPRQIGKAIRRLGLRTAVAGIGVTAVAFVHFGVGAFAIMLLHEAWLAGLVLLWICWFSVWHSGAFALRTVGLWHHRTRNMTRASPASGAAYSTPAIMRPMTCRCVRS